MKNWIAKLRKIKGTDVLNLFLLYLIGVYKFDFVTILIRSPICSECYCHLRLKMTERAYNE
ncbi:hypothetical protein AOB46_08105 [Chryseobacterium indologenes]|uniref:Uncharacterized protein n=1 Tax=Chryseobacterium indologenes TaxID=253 RepID=A0A0N0IWS7_CHRID|nr:hypothetical protein AOB46_08105 [Chryseobacterium indologenes]